MSLDFSASKIRQAISVLLVVFLLWLAVQPVGAAVTLVYFTAIGSDTQITIEWETASEVDMIGFYVLKSGQVDGNYLQISDLILSQGDAFGGATYQFVDTDVVTGTTYYYKLQVLDQNQQSEYYGPIAGYSGVETPTPTVTITSETGEAPTLTYTVTVSQPTNIITNTGTATITSTLKAATSSPTPKTSNTVTITSDSSVVNTYTRTPTSNTLTTGTKTPTKTRTPQSVFFSTSTQRPFAVTRTMTPAGYSTKSDMGSYTATNADDQQFVFEPTETKTADLINGTVNTTAQTETQNGGSSSIAGWMSVGLGGSILVAGAGWLILFMIRRKRVE